MLLCLISTHRMQTRCTTGARFCTRMVRLHTHMQRSRSIFHLLFLFKKKGLLTQKAMEMRSVYDLTRQVDMYLELFCTFALKCTQLITNPFLKKKTSLFTDSNKVSLKAPVALAQLTIPAIGTLVCATLQRLSTSPDSRLRAKYVTLFLLAPLSWPFQRDQVVAARPAVRCEFKQVARGRADGRAREYLQDRAAIVVHRGSRREHL